MSTDIACSCMGQHFDKFIQPHILMILTTRAMYGLEIINELKKYPLFLNKSPDPTGIYRYLKKMEGAGLLSSSLSAQTEGEPSKRFYTITSEGKNCLCNWTVALAQYSVDIMTLVSDLEDCLSR